MPLYEYGCESCGKTLEVQQKLSDAPLKTCPACGKETLQKLISATSFVLKGGGWYKDGYSGTKSKRTDNDRTDRLQKAISDDKKKTEKKETGGGGGGSSSDGGGGGGSTGGTGGSSSSDSGGGTKSAAAA